MNIALKAQAQRAFVRASNDLRGDDAKLIKDLLAEIDHGAVDPTYAALFRHCEEVDTKFDKQGRAKQIKAVFKIATETSVGMQESVKGIVTEFVENAAVFPDALPLCRRCEDLGECRPLGARGCEGLKGKKNV